MTLGTLVGGLMAWGANNIIPLALEPLNIFEASFLAVQRCVLGIPVDFEDPFLILGCALGIPPALGAPAQYVIRALTEGGYLTHTTCVLYNLQTLMIHVPPLFVLFGIVPPDYILIQIANEQRVSKNIRELS